MKLPTRLIAVAALAAGLVLSARAAVETYVPDPAHSSIGFTIRQIDENITLLKMDLLIVPTIPAPQSALDEELRDAAMDAVRAMHDRAQGHTRYVVYPPTAR